MSDRTIRKDSEPARLQVQMVGGTTWDDMRQSIDALRNLFETVNEALNGDRATIKMLVPAITIFDGAEYDKEAPWAEPCADECLDSAPTFFNAPTCVVFICRGCGRKACWRHSFTDETGGWCVHCNPFSTIPREGDNA